MGRPRFGAPAYPSGSGPGTLTRAAVAAVAAALLAGALSVGTAHARQGCGKKTGAWTTLPAPEFPSGDGAISGLAVNPVIPDEVFVTNGASVVSSRDRGCTWTKSYELPSTPAPDEPYTSEDASIERVVAAGGIVMLMIAQEAPAFDAPHVVASRDGGESWSAGVGLPPRGSPEALVLAPNAPMLAFLGVSYGDGAVDVLYATMDSGKSWELRSDFAEEVLSDITETPVGRGVEDLAVDPLDPDLLWAWGPSGLYRSSDGGRSFAPVPAFASTPVGPVDIFRDRGEPARIVAVRPGEPDAMRSDDGGESWFKIDTPGRVGSASTGPSKESLVVAAEGKVWLFLRRTFEWTDLGAPASGVRDIAFDRARAPSLYGHTGRTLEIHQPAVGELSDKDLTGPLLNLNLRQPELPPERPPSLSPGDRRIELEVGERRTVRYRLDPGAAPTKLDVYFLIDTSDSMKDFLAGLGRGIQAIINGLGDRGIDAHYGVGEYRSYPHDLQQDDPERNFVYRRVRDIGPVEPSLGQALRSLEPDAGGRYKAQLGGLYQTATGEGQDVHPPGPLGPDIARGQQATFRGEAERVVIHATDEPFVHSSDDDPDPRARDIPNEEDVIEALQKKSILQVGLAIGADHGGQIQNDLGRVARATGAVAPGGGTDCNGDGNVDLKAEDPLVCRLGLGGLSEAGNLVPAIVNLVDAVRHQATVSLGATTGGRVVERIAPRVYEGVVFNRDRRLSFDVAYRCSAPLAGQEFPVTLRASRGSEELAGAEAVIVCGGLDEVLPLAPAAAAGLAALAVPPPPPPPPVPEVAAQAQAQSQAQSQAQAQGAVMAQRQEQPQVGVAHSAHQAQEEYSLSSARRTEPEIPPQAFLGGAGLLMSLAFGFAMRTRARTAVRFARRGG